MLRRGDIVKIAAIFAPPPEGKKANIISYLYRRWIQPPVHSLRIVTYARAHS